jgi:hypothetical protein
MACKYMSKGLWLSESDIDSVSQGHGFCVLCSAPGVVELPVLSNVMPGVTSATKVVPG